MLKQIEQIFKNHGVEPIGFAPFALVALPGKRLPFEGIQTVIIASFPYLPPQPYQPTNLCLYARLPDYHRVIKTILSPIVDELEKAFPGHRFSPFADSSPVREVYAASLAGLGCIGKNGLLITPKYGSFVFLGGLLTDLAIESALCEPIQCRDCGRCFSACPTGALSPAGLDRSKCLSAITQKKGQLSEEEERAICKNGMVWGCDQCQLACPMNRDARPSSIREFTDNIRPSLSEADLDTDLSDRAFIWRGIEVLRRNLKLTESPKP